MPPILTFFNNKGGVGKTSLIYHLAWMYSTLQKRVLAVDLDPQANLTAAFLDEDRIDEIWRCADTGSTIFQCIKPLNDFSDIAKPILQNITQDLYLLPGDVMLSSFEDTLTTEWPRSMNDNNIYRPMRILSSFWQTIQMAATEIDAELILVDIGPNLGAINRSALIATDYVVIPLGADLFSLQGLRNLGPALRNWKSSWTKRMENWFTSKEAVTKNDFLLPTGKMEVIGYLCQQHGVRLDRPVKAYDRWVNQIPQTYRNCVLEIPGTCNIVPSEDSNCLGTIKHYRSLVPMGQEKRKPIFNLTSADGAIGSHASAVQDAKTDFMNLAFRIAAKMDLSL